MTTWTKTPPSEPGLYWVCRVDAGVIGLPDPCVWARIPYGPDHWCPIGSEVGCTDAEMIEEGALFWTEPLKSPE